MSHARPVEPSEGYARNSAGQRDDVEPPVEESWAAGDAGAPVGPPAAPALEAAPAARDGTSLRGRARSSSPGRKSLATAALNVLRRSVSPGPASRDGSSRVRSSVSSALKVSVAPVRLRVMWMARSSMNWLTSFPLQVQAKNVRPATRTGATPPAPPPPAVSVKLATSHMGGAPAAGRKVGAAKPRTPVAERTTAAMRSRVDKVSFVFLALCWLVFFAKCFL